MDASTNITWHNVEDWGIEGKAFSDSESYFDRFPARAQNVIRKEVWDLSRQSAGMLVRFDADTTAVHVRYTLSNEKLGSAHMPPTGVSGVDLYTHHTGQWRWCATLQPESVQIEKAIMTGMDSGRRPYLINLPLYNGVKKFEIGLPAGATFSPVPPRKEKPILFYGTSIMQGACASRPGMSYTAMLGRRLNLPVLNFGFSGNGKMEPEVGRFLSELDPLLFVLDCLPNMTADLVNQNTAAMVRQLHAARPNTPILLMHDRIRTEAFLVKQIREDHAAKRAAYKKAYEQLLSEGVKNLHFENAKDILGTDNEATVDGSHPNDLGMMRYAEAMEPVLKKILKQI